MMYDFAVKYDLGVACSFVPARLLSWVEKYGAKMHSSIKNMD